MRVLAAADIHGVHEVYSWLVRVVGEKRPDALVLAGDLLKCLSGYDSVEEAQRADGMAVAGILERIDVPVFYIMGNDDMVELEPKSGNIRSIHSVRIEMGDYNFVGYQYSLPFMAGVYEKPEVEIQEDLAPLEPLVGERTVFVTHNPAYGVLDVGVLDWHAGSTSILDLVARRRPVVHIHGHIHQEFGRYERHFNVAADGRPRAVMIDLRTLKHEIIEENGLPD